MASGDLVSLAVRSINHRAHGFDGLARLTANATSGAALHGSFCTHGLESIVFTTCNRLEVYWRAPTAQHNSIATGILASSLGIAADTLSGQSSCMTGDAAANHLFRVCAGLESLVLGEAEVLGQARAALDACPGAGSFLTGVFRAAIRTGRAARAETAIGEGALSVASTTTQWLSARMPLGDRRVLILGAGDTARKVARHLSAIGVGALVIANRTLARAEALAAPLGAQAVELDALPDDLFGADAVISAVNTSGYVLTLAQLRQRSQRAPLVAIDLSMPPSIEPGEAGGLLRIDLAVLEQAAHANRRQRETEVPRVEAVIDREMEFLRRWARREALRPIFAGSRQEREA